MAHLVIQYSANLDHKVDMPALCEELCSVMADTGIFPLGGVRVRAFGAEAYAVADGDPKNAFADLVLRMGAGRSPEDKKGAGEAILAAAKAHFSALLAEPHFALSLEIVEIDPVLSWKINSIHPRLKQGDRNKSGQTHGRL